MPSAALQRKLVLDDKPAFVLSDINGARLALPGHDEDDILMLIEEGKLEYAWNIAVATDEDKRREIRIFPDCVSWYKQHQGKKPFPLNETQALAHLLSITSNKPYLTSKRLSLLWNCGTTHVIKLIECKRLAVLPGTSWGTGPNGSALITIESITSFLKSRRLP